jgi:hypothetical protein
MRSNDSADNDTYGGWNHAGSTDGHVLTSTSNVGINIAAALDQNVTDATGSPTAMMWLWPETGPSGTSCTLSEIIEADDSSQPVCFGLNFVPEIGSDVYIHSGFYIPDDATGALVFTVTYTASAA